MKDAHQHRFADFKQWFGTVNKCDITPTEEHKESSRSLFNQSIPFLEKVPVNPESQILDIGCGYGYHCEWFAEKSRHVVGITNHINQSLKESANRLGYQVRQMDMHELEYDDDSVDVIWSHHSLEHSFCPLFMLREYQRILKNGGHLAVSVPPHSYRAVSGHFTIGWHLPQLMYLLLISGFDVKNGYFIEDGYNIRAMVSKDKSVNLDGTAYLMNALDHLPNAAKEIIRETPNSLGGYVLDDRIKELDAKNNMTRFKNNNSSDSNSSSFAKWIKQKTRFF